LTQIDWLIAFHFSQLHFWTY